MAPLLSVSRVVSQVPQIRRTERKRKMTAKTLEAAIAAALKNDKKHRGKSGRKAIPKKRVDVSFHST
jgi:hypothetical protein